MLSRLEVTGSAMISRMAQFEAVANNLANISTNGYKRDLVFVESLHTKMQKLSNKHGAPSTSVPQANAMPDLSQGGLVSTGRPLDVAISGAGFFVVETGSGEAYTRDGRLTLDSEGVLTSIDGHPLLGAGGPIQLNNIEQFSGAEILINENGEIIMDGNVIDRLQIVAPADPRHLIKTGSNLFRLAADSGAMLPQESAVVKQGFLEQSNVDPLLEMVSMMEILRNFQIDEKMVRTQDEILGHAANQIGRLA